MLKVLFISIGLVLVIEGLLYFFLANKLDLISSIIKNLNPKKRPISAVADNIEFRNAKTVMVKIDNKIKFNLLYNSNSTLEKKIKIEQSKKEKRLN